MYIIAALRAFGLYSSILVPVPIPVSIIGIPHALPKQAMNSINFLPYKTELSNVPPKPLGQIAKSPVFFLISDSISVLGRRRDMALRNMLCLKNELMESIDDNNHIYHDNETLTVHELFVLNIVPTSRA